MCREVRKRRARILKRYNEHEHQSTGSYNKLLILVLSILEFDVRIWNIERCML